MQINRLRKLDSLIEKINLNLLESGMAVIDEDWKGEDIYSVYNRVYYIIEGTGAHVESETEHVELLPGHVYLIPAGYRYNYWCNGNAKKVYFHINIKRYDGYDAFSGFGRIGEIYMPEIVNEVADLYESSKNYAACSIKGALFRSIAAFSEKYSYSIEESGKIGYTKLLREATKYIQVNLSVKLTREEIANHCNVSQSKLAKCFKNELGISMGKYIDDLVFIEAIKRLIYSDDSIGKISEDLGFCDQFYFSRRFSELYQITPLKYRVKMQHLR